MLALVSSNCTLLAWVFNKRVSILTYLFDMNIVVSYEQRSHPLKF